MSIENINEYVKKRIRNVSRAEIIKDGKEERVIICIKERYVEHCIQEIHNVEMMKKNVVGYTKIRMELIDKQIENLRRVRDGF